jgi:hypothetical protein
MTLRDFRIEVSGVTSGYREFLGSINSESLGYHLWSDTDTACPTGKATKCTGTKVKILSFHVCYRFSRHNEAWSSQLRVVQK